MSECNLNYYYLVRHEANIKIEAESCTLGVDHSLINNLYLLARVPFRTVDKICTVLVNER